MEKNPNIKQLISAYYDGETTLEESAVVEKHLQEFPECQKYYESLGKISSSLEAWKNEDLSPDLTQKMAQSLADSNIKEGREMEKQNTLKVLSTAGVWVAIIAVIVVGTQRYSRIALLNKRVKPEVGSQELGWSDVASTVGVKKDVVLGEGKAVTSTIVLQDAALQAAAPQVTDKKVSKPYDAYYAEKESRVVPITNTLKQAQVLSEGLVKAKAIYRGRQDKNLAGATPSISADYPYEVSDSDMREGAEIYPMTHHVEPVFDIDRAGQPFHTEEYDRIYENEFLDVTQNPLSTFSIDVDTASYSNMRRFLTRNQMPPKDAVRIEELINYFSYDYPEPEADKPFSITTEVAGCPWNNEHNIALIGLQGKTLKEGQVPPNNLVFLIDVSGSMSDQNKLPLLKSAFKLMVNSLSARDTVSIVVYAGSAGIVLEPTPGDQKSTIIAAIDRLHSGGSTAGGQGIRLAYETARKHLLQNGNNRVILATDGDFNVGTSSDSELVRMIEERRDDGIFLTILGFGMGNYKDSKMEKLADKGNGNYAYIDTIGEAKKVMVSELGSMLFAIAKDVKLQIEFNPNKVSAYRLIGYENRMLAKEDFNDDTKDAGELGAGHTVTAIYELVPAGLDEVHDNVDALKYQEVKVRESDDLMTVKLRYKEPKESTSKLITNTIASSQVTDKPISNNLNFASAVAEFGLLIRDSKQKASANYQSVLDRARQAKGSDNWGYRAEFINLVERAKSLGLHRISPGVIMFKGGQKVE